ncbi:MAG: hypothetical protein AB1531_06505, partial [Chloroflexota bacterium]
QYPIEYYDSYFVSWGEVCAAARTTGMTEFPPNDQNPLSEQPSLLDTAQPISLTQTNVAADSPSTSGEQLII